MSVFLKQNRVKMFNLSLESQIFLWISSFLPFLPFLSKARICSRWRIRRKWFNLPFKRQKNRVPQLQNGPKFIQNSQTGSSALQRYGSVIELVLWCHGIATVAPQRYFPFILLLQLQFSEKLCVQSFNFHLVHFSPQILTLLSIMPSEIATLGP